MAANADIIKEFLIKLGYNIDASSEQRFNSRLAATTSAVTKLGLGLTAMAVAATYATMRVASELEKVYFAARRAGTTVEDLKAVSFGAQQIGISAETARESVASLARSLRLNPGMEGLLGSLGVQTRDVNGHLKDTTELYSGLIKQLRDRFGTTGPGFAVGAQIAGQFGIDPDTLYMAEKGYDEAQAAAERYHKTLQTLGLNEDEAAEISHRFRNSMRDLGMQTQLVAELVFTKLMPYLQQFAEWLARTVVDLETRYGPTIRRVVNEITTVLDDAAHGEWKKAWSDALSAWQNEFGALDAYVANFAKSIKDYLAAEGVNWAEWDAAFAHLKASMGDIFSSAGGLAVEIGHKFKDAWDELFPGLSADTKVLVAEISHGAAEALQSRASIVEDVAKLMRGLTAELKGNWTEAWKDFGEVGADAWGVIARAANTTFATMQDIWNWLKKPGDWFGGADPGKLPPGMYGPELPPEMQPKLEMPAPDTGIMHQLWKWTERNLTASSNPRLNDAIPTEGQALLNAIVPGESNGSYDDQLSSVGARGRYQFTKDTWNDIAKEHGLPDFDDPRSKDPGTQDIAAWYLAQERYAQRTGRDLLSDLRAGRTELVAPALDPTWTSLPGGREPNSMTPGFDPRLQRNLAYPNSTPAPDHKIKIPLGSPLSLPGTPLPPGLEGGFTTGSLFGPQSAYGFGPQLAMSGPMGAPANVNLTQTNNITVNGQSDPASTANRLKSTIERTNGDIVRNMKSALV